MTTEDKENNDVVSDNHLSMSDADFLNAPIPEDVPVEPQEEDNTSTEDVDDKEEEPKDESSDNDEGQAESADPEEVSTEGTDNKDPKEEKSDTNIKEEKEKSVPKEEVVIDYKAAYDKLFTPFKANGREVKIDNVDDAISLMQMGANYNKKMAGLKPSLKILKLLENNGLLDESKLSFLIDLDKKDPAAINKLVTDSGINPMDLDSTTATNYKAKVHTVDEREIDLDTVLDEIQDTPTYTRTLNIVSQQWDTASKQNVAAHPQLLKIINNHIADGVYDVINAKVEQQRMLGNLNGVSDLDAYRKIGDELHAQGGFNHLAIFQRNTIKEPVIVKPKTKQTDPALKDKRKAASSSTGADPAVPKEFNPLSMSDAEFAKLADPRYT